MKTNKNNSVKTSSFKLVCLLTLLVTLGCSDQKGFTQQKQSSDSETKAPAVDIHTAVLTDNSDALKQHIAAGSNLNEKDPYGGSSPLISAALFGKTEMAKILIEADADINFRNNEGSTALHTAAFFCRPEIVKMLLDKGADKTIRNKYESTAYESVAGPFSELKSSYDMMGQMLAPMGLKLDYAYIEKTRPEIAAMLK
ncbi:ankyrin repeat domain-containing protein [Marivirga sp. S37H4]|uniref:Ankyrin repeat domain-containing protein n=1 Tax=Marivirga aurantiaca TaxID=2802615 RepID=A0A934WVZ3_9BACT|nr:ankyrin repeat domain-containing protein [Marivirga aurantiaca]MBK6263946.1 ankyrin repeat domain-containing protein [Marivirga aurantiaca]